MKKRALALLLCLLLLPFSLPGVPAETPQNEPPGSGQGIVPAGKEDFDVPCAAAILIDEDSGAVLYEKNAEGHDAVADL